MRANVRGLFLMLMNIFSSRIMREFPRIPELLMPYHNTRNSDVRSFVPPCPNDVHFRNCFSFEQSLPNWMTTRKLWSRTFILRLIARSRLVVQVSGGALTRKSSVAPFNQNHICGKIGSTQFLEQGLSPCSFFKRFGARPHSRSRKFEPISAFFFTGSKSQ